MIQRAWVWNQFPLSRLIFASTLVMAALAGCILIAPSVHAKAYAEMNPDEKAKSYVYYYGVVGCVTDIKSISNSDVISGGFKGKTNTINSWYTDPTDGKRECQTILPNAISLWGYGDLSSALKAWGYKEPNTPGGDWTNDTPGADTARAILDKVYGGKNPGLSGAEAYLYWKRTLQQNCQLSNPVAFDSASAAIKNEVSGGSSKNYVVVIEPKQPYDGSTVKNIYKIGKSVTVVPVGPVNSPLNGSADCSQLAAKITEGIATSYANYGKANSTEATQLDKNTGAQGEASSSKTTCAIEGIGWIVCPVMNFLADLNEKAFEQLTKLLEVEPSLLLGNDGQTPLKDAWSKFRDIANVLFVIAFLYIVYRQMVGSN